MQALLKKYIIGFSKRICTLATRILGVPPHYGNFCCQQYHSLIIPDSSAFAVYNRKNWDGKSIAAINLRLHFSLTWLKTEQKGWLILAFLDYVHIILASGNKLSTYFFEVYTSYCNCYSIFCSIIDVLLIWKFALSLLDY